MLVSILAFSNKTLEQATATGIIATLYWEVGVIVKTCKCSKPKVPSHQIFGKSPRGNKTQCGAIWIKENKGIGKNRFTFSIQEKDSSQISDRLQARMTPPFKPSPFGVELNLIISQGRLRTPVSYCTT